MVLHLCPLGLFQPFSRILISKCPWPWLHKWFSSLQGGIKSYEEGTWLLLTDIKMFSVDVRQHSLYELDSHPFILLIFAYFILPHSFQHLIPGTQPHTPQGYDSLISLLFKTEAVTNLLIQPAFLPIVLTALSKGSCGIDDRIYVTRVLLKFRHAGDILYS